MSMIEDQPTRSREDDWAALLLAGDYDTPEQITHRSSLSSTSPSDYARERKRRHHRESMARLRTLWRKRAEQLNQLEETLHDELLVKLSCVERNRAIHEAAACRVFEYAELVQAAEALRREQYALEDQLATWNKYRKLVATETCRLESEVQEEDDEEIITRESSAAIIEDQLKWVAETRLALTQSNECETNILDWRVRRATSTNPDTNVITSSVSCSRLLQSVSIAELQGRTWSIVNTPALLSFVRGLHVAMSSAQSISNDAIVMKDTSRIDERHQYTLYSRRDSHDGQSNAVLMIPLSGKRPVMSSSRPARGGVAALQLSQANDGVYVEYVASMVCSGDVDSVMHSVEACAFLMRWELLVLPPRLLPPSHEESKNQHNPFNGIYGNGI